MEQVMVFRPSALKVHPRNAEFFDDIGGEEFDRLVESIKNHGILTPLRATKDMTIISGHQRLRAAIEAGCNDIPVIIDDSEDDDDILMKLIETNFGRMKNDPIKQAKWVSEYEKLKGVRQGSNSEYHNDTRITEEDIAKELGVKRLTLQRLKSLLKLDPAIQSLISEGKINATTGFTILSKLSLEEQQKLLDKLPDDVKFSAKSIDAKIREIRAEGAANANAVQQENDSLRGRIEALNQERNELLSGKLPISEAQQKQIGELKEKVRKYYEEKERQKRRADQFQEQFTKAIEAKNAAEAKARGGDECAIEFQNEIDKLTEEKKVIERERNDLEFQISEMEDEINRLKQEGKDGFMRSAITPGFTSEEYNERALINYKNKISQGVTSFQTLVNEIMKDVGLLTKMDSDTISALTDIVKLASQSAQMLYKAIAGDKTSSDRIDIPA